MIKGSGVGMGSENDILMERYPFLKKNVMVYDDKKDISLLMNPSRKSQQKLSLLSKNEALLLHQLGGNNKIKDICHNVPINEKLILDMLKKWSGKEWDMVTLLEVPLEEARIKIKEQTKYANIYRQWRQAMDSAKQASEDNSILKEYHKKEIRDAIEQFDGVETTVSHIYSEPHVILGGKNYGASFANVLMQKGIIREGIKILEVGGGIGLFAKSFLDEILNVAPQVYKNIKYTLFEISPALLKSQRQILKKHSNLTKFIQGDIETCDFKHKKFDLIISNEMIADLNTVKLKRSDIKRSSLTSEYKKRAASLIKKFKLNIGDAPKEFLFNLGAIEFLHDIKKILAVGGKAYIVEYGNEWSYPKASRLKGHTEYSIHFGFLMKVADQLNMDPRLIPLVDFLPFNKRIKVINATSFFLINDYLLPFLNRERIPKKVYTEEMLRKKIGEIFDRLSFVGLTYLGSREATLDPSVFFMLDLGLKRLCKEL